MTNLEKKLVELGYEDKTPFITSNRVYLRKGGLSPVIVVNVKEQSIHISLYEYRTNKVVIGIPMRGKRLVKGDDFNKIGEAIEQADNYKAHAVDAQETYLQLLRVKKPWEVAK